MAGLVWSVMSETRAKNPPLGVLAVLLAWLVPGLGHIYMGKVTRGIVIMITITVTFWAGMGLGGVMTVDPQNDRWWFIADMFTGVQAVGAWQYQQKTLEKVITKWNAEHDGNDKLPPDATTNPNYVHDLDAAMAREGIALAVPVETIARAYSGVAGLLNLLCIFDVIMLGLMGEHGEAGPESQEEMESAEGDKT